MSTIYRRVGASPFPPGSGDVSFLKMVDGEPIGDPLDVKMFAFTKWTLEEGMSAGMGKIKGPSGMDQPAALVQTVVRPPGTGTFDLRMH